MFRLNLSNSAGLRAMQSVVRSANHRFLSTMGSEKLNLTAALKVALKDAMKSQNKLNVVVLKSLLSEITYSEKAALAVGNSATKEAPATVLLKCVKKRKDAALAYRENGRAELAEREEEEIKVIESFLPRQLSPSELDEIVSAVVSRLNATSIKEMGKVMKAVEAEIIQGSATKQSISDSIKKAFKS